MDTGQGNALNLDGLTIAEAEAVAMARQRAAEEAALAKQQLVDAMRRKAEADVARHEASAKRGAPENKYD